MKPRVFIPQEPTKFDHDTGQRLRSIDLSPAAEYGELVFITPTGERMPLDTRGTVEYIAQAMEDFGPEDYLVPVGHPALIAICAVEAVRASGSRLKMLIWNNRDARYTPMTLDFTPIGGTHGPSKEATRTGTRPSL